MYRLMRSMTLPKPSTVKPKRTPQKDSGECHDLLRRQFHQSAPNLVWVSDFTYLRVNRTWYFLCIVMDLFSRKIIGWSLSSKHDTALIIAAFHKAYQSRNISYGLIFHSDQGAEYTASSFRKLLDANNIVQSFSKKGCPFDNACCESFFKFLKKNLPIDVPITLSRSYVWTSSTISRIFITIGFLMDLLHIKPRMNLKPISSTASHRISCSFLCLLY